MPDPTDPRAAADDPSGIVQQMPDGGDQALKPCPFCGKPPKIDNYGNGYYRIDHWCYDMVMDNFIAVEGERKSDVETRWNRRATEANLRAEVEGLKAELKKAQGDAVKFMLRCDSAAIAFQSGDPDRAYRIIMGDFRTALSPETDGDQDG